VLLATSVLLAAPPVRGADPQARPAEKPRAVILLDVSAPVTKYSEKPKAAERAALLLAEQIGDAVIVSFADEAWVMPQATGDFRRQEVKVALDPPYLLGLRANYIAGLEAAARVDPTVPVILVTVGKVPDQRKRVIDYYRRSGRLVHVVGWERLPEEREFMRELANAAGGGYFAAKDVKDLIRLFTDVPPGLRIVAGNGPLAAGLSHPIRVEFTELDDPLEDGWFVHYDVRRAAVAGELRLLDARGQVLERRPIPAPVRGPAADITIALPDGSGPYTLEARATLGRFSAEARADLYAERVCRPVLLPHQDLGTLDGDSLHVSVPVATDPHYRCDYLLTVSDLQEAGGRVVPLNLARQADFERASEGAAGPGPKYTVEAKDVLGAHALARLQGPGKVALVAGPSAGQTRLPPGVYKATLSVAPRHAPRTLSSTTLTLTVPEPPKPPEPSTPPPVVASRDHHDAELARLRLRLLEERRTRTDEQREAEKRATSAEVALAEQVTRQLFLVIALIALSPLACFGCTAVWKWIWESSEEPPPRRVARAAVSPRATVPVDDCLPTFDDLPEEERGGSSRPDGRTTRQAASPSGVIRTSPPRCDFRPSPHGDFR
jgi:hypothetical protein